MKLTTVIKRLAARGPESLQLALRRLRYRWLIRTGRFGSDEPEFERLSEWVHPGDWVIDVGANIGSYTMALSDLVGPTGRVVALEPVPTTFELLTRHVGRLNGGNVTLLNVAATERTGSVEMRVPRLATGLENIYQSKIVRDGGGARDGEGAFKVLAMRLDALALDEPVRLIKIDVEGHEGSVLRGAAELIERDRPVLVLEGDSPEFESILNPLGYRRKRFEGSPNTVYLPERPSEA